MILLDVRKAGPIARPQSRRVKCNSCYINAPSGIEIGFPVIKRFTPARMLMCECAHVCMCEHFIVQSKVPADLILVLSKGKERIWGFLGVLCVRVSLFTICSACSVQTRYFAALTLLILHEAIRPPVGSCMYLMHKLQVLFVTAVMWGAPCARVADSICWPHKALIQLSVFIERLTQNCMK